MELPDYNSEGTPIVRTHIVGHLNITPLRRSERKPRYQDVAAEFDRLGETAFIQTYYTPQLKARIDNAAYKRPVYGVPQPGADRNAFENFGPVTDKWGETFRIDWIDDGWRFIVCRDGIAKDGYAYNGDAKQKPFASSEAAYTFLRHGG